MTKLAAVAGAVVLAAATAVCVGQALADNIFLNNKGVVAKATEMCANYLRGDMSLWNWA